MKRSVLLVGLEGISGSAVTESVPVDARVLLRLNPESISSTKQFPEPFPSQFSDKIITIQHLDGHSLIDLESGAKLRATSDRMELVDRYGELVGNIIFNEPAPARKLRKHQPIPPAEPEAVYNVPPPIQGEFKAYPSEMYCRYGCGNLLGVTFPYYYRPFFGYGYPLLGTETQFPSGYGGNPMTNLGVAGALSGGAFSSNHFY